MFYVFEVDVANDNGDTKLLKFSVEFKSEDDFERYCTREDWLDELCPFVNKRLLELNENWTVDDCIDMCGQTDRPLDVHIVK